MVRKWALFILVICCAGCAGVQEPVTPQPPITFEPLPTAQTVGDCDSPDVLEGWLQTFALRYQEFNDLLQDTPQQPERLLYDNILQMRRAVTVIASRPVPTCAVDARRLMLSAMQITIGELQQYVNEEQGDLDSIITNAEISFAPALALRDELLTTLDALYSRE